jgi:hypothetical protein
MIIWIASYPKSGNTYLRSFLSTYFYSKNGKFDFNLLLNINQFPSFRYSNRKAYTYFDAAQNWIPNQKEFFNKEKTFFLKTHNSLEQYFGHKFTTSSETLGAIYIVRDPRNVILSMSHHYSLSYEKSYEKIVDKKSSLIEKTFNEDHSNFTFLGTWSDHYKSWRDNKDFKVLFIKYEDFEENIVPVFKKVINFINELRNETNKIEDNKFFNAIKSTNFASLKNKENTLGFEESVYSDKGKKINFFNLGFQNKWQNKLPDDIVKKVNKNLNKEIIELGYNLNE